MCVSLMAKVRDTRPDLPWPVTKIFFALRIDERNSSLAFSSIFSSTECISSRIICMVPLIPMELQPVFICFLFLPYFNPDNRSTGSAHDEVRVHLRPKENSYTIKLSRRNSTMLYPIFQVIISFNRPYLLTFIFVALSP